MEFLGFSDPEHADTSLSKGKHDCISYPLQLTSKNNTWQVPCKLEVVCSRLGTVALIHLAIDLDCYSHSVKTRAASGCSEIQRSLNPSFLDRKTRRTP